jgi:phosphotransferase system HPr (HPr) family protein
LNTAEAKVTVANEHGLHARPVTQFAQLANQFTSKIEVIKGEVVCNGKSIMSMLRLMAPMGTPLKIKAEGPDAQQAVKALAKLVESGFPLDGAPAAKK